MAYTRDQIMSSVQTLSQLFSEHGFANEESATVSPRRVDCKSRERDTLIELFNLLEQHNDKLTQSMTSLKQCDIDSLNDDLKRTESIDTTYFAELRRFGESLRTIRNHMQAIESAVSKRSQPGTFKMEYEYQKLAVKYLMDTRNELINFEQYYQACDRLSEFSRSNDASLMRSELQLASLYEKLNQSVELALSFHQLFSQDKNNEAGKLV